MLSSLRQNGGLNSKTAHGEGAMNRSRMAIALIAIVALLLAVGMSCGGDGTQPTPTPTPNPTPTTEYFEIGQWAETGQQRLTVASATRSPSYTYRREFYTEIAPPGTVFIIIEATVINQGITPLAISPSRFSLKDSQGHRYSYASYKGDDPYPTMSLDAGETTAGGKILFIVPEVASGLEVSYLLRSYVYPRLLAIWQLKW